jgi:hypothetical protein
LIPDPDPGSGRFSRPDTAFKTPKMDPWRWVRNVNDADPAPFRKKFPARLQSQWHRPPGRQFLSYQHLVSERNVRIWIRGGTMFGSGSGGGHPGSKKFGPTVPEKGSNAIYYCILHMFYYDQRCRSKTLS